MMKERALKFDSKQILYDEIIGTGDDTTVYSYQSNDKQDIWVVKCIPVDNIDKLLQIMEEIVLSYDCDHQNVNSVKGYSVVSIDKVHFKVYVKLQQMQGNLSSLLKKEQVVPEQEFIKYLHSLISGLEYLHTKEIAHQNIKPTNILFDNNDDLLKLADMSCGEYSERRDRLSRAQSETLEMLYLPPELLDGKEVNAYKADIWSLGRSLLDLLLCSSSASKSEIFKDEDQNEAIRKALLELQNVYSSDLLNILQEMLSFEPEKRRTAQEIKYSIESKFHQNSTQVSQQRASFTNEASISDTVKKPWNTVFKELQKKWNWHFKLKSDKPQQLEVSKTW